MTTLGNLGDSHDLSQRARRYANEVIFAEQWPLTSDHVDLSRVTFETSTRMTRQHGLCASDRNGNCTIRISKQTHDRAGFDAIKQTIRHELVHAYQHQTPGVDPDHGESFKQWIDPLDLSGRCGTHYEKQPEDYKYQFYCVDGCGFIGGRHRWSVAVARAIEGSQICSTCDAQIRVEGPDGVLDQVPEWRDKTSFEEDDLRYRFYCENCGLIGGRRQMCKTVRRVVKDGTICQNCGSLEIETRDKEGNVVASEDL